MCEWLLLSRCICCVSVFDCLVNVLIWFGSGVLLVCICMFGCLSFMLLCLILCLSSVI